MHYSYEFVWNNVKFLDQEQFYNKLIVSEMLHIKQQCNGLNLQSDTDMLYHAYLSILNKL